jgi:hypothetical protein
MCWLVLGKKHDEAGPATCACDVHDHLFNLLRIAVQLQ